MANAKQLEPINKIVMHLAAALDDLKPTDEIEAATMVEKMMKDLPDTHGNSFRSFSAFLVAKLWFRDSWKFDYQ